MLSLQDLLHQGQWHSGKSLQAAIIPWSGSVRSSLETSRATRVFFCKSLCKFETPANLSTARIGLWQDRKNLAVLFSDGCAVIRSHCCEPWGRICRCRVPLTNMKTRPLFPSAVESGGKHAEARLCSSCLCGWALGWLDTIISYHGRPCLVKKP